ncbi:ATP-dependent DNA helicase DinG [Pseudalkalibacillus caeni]|uniref:3'-5' exonuclease DinG n=1 Tax=Exobacillus caeni TaxID=2574798 RepID=A0A5R9F823_9BACL|nr:ATP-dependent DNA helicase DinG [Pseudalkalibacillus caeni]TLS35885.1 ATP-dependent DNA helicase DinG [Pseudalkalibacillus caeni]
MKNRYVILDLEATGNSPKNGDRIIQVGAVVVEENKIIDRYSSFVNAAAPIPLFVEQLTGISEEVLDDAPDFLEVAPELLKRLDGAYLVAHNVRFDLAFLNFELERCGYEAFMGPVIDTVELSRMLLPRADAYKLNQLADYLSIDHANPHQADSDAEVTAQIFIYLMKKMEALPLLTLQNLEPLVKRFHSDVEHIITALIRKKLTSLQQDEEEIDVFRQLALKWYEEKEDKGDRLEVDFTASREEMMKELSTVMQGFELREGQTEMMKAINEAQEEKRHAIIEAGTGIGKSLAYLLPSIYLAKKTGKPVVISTHTIQLQQQLLDRDIPLLKEILPFDINAALLKGRNNYIDLRRFEQQLFQTEENNYDTVLSKAQILIWLLETDYGDVDELNLPSGGKIFWHQIKSDVNVSLTQKSPWFSRCFYQRRRREAQQADIIITNHALLFTDLVANHQLLPAYDNVIVDEAHHLEDIVGDYFGVRTDYFSLLQQFDRIGLKDGSGLNVKIKDLLEEKGLFRELEQLNVTEDQTRVVLSDIDETFRMLHSYAARKVSGSNEIGRLSYRLTDEEGEYWEAITEAANRVVFGTRDILKQLKGIVKALEEKQEHLSMDEKGIVADFQSMVNALGEEGEKINYLMLEHHANEVKWIEVDPKGPINSAFLFSKPVEVGELLADQFFEKKDSVVLTSATLSVKNSFSYILERLGLEAFDPITKQLESPFDYEEQARLMVPVDLPLIKDVSSDVYVQAISAAIVSIARVTRGRMLVLFTSYDMLKKTHFVVKNLLEEDDISLISQGVDSGSRMKLTKNFKQTDEAILFGTSSFWEGVDLPGEDLSCLIIVRLPFSPPDNPLFESRSEVIKKEGGNPFMDLSLPQAIIRFKQGFGRLVRTQKDRGVVFVFDRRIISTRYGKLFIQSLPPVPVLKAPTEDLLNELDIWL